jgi:pimeloyl-ACP methyl ester carboxylesterase
MGTIKWIALAVVAASSGIASAQEGWKADPKQIEALEAKKTSWMYREEQVPKYELPDVLRGVKDGKEWERRGRPETLELFRGHVYGRPPLKMDSVSFDVLEMDAKAMEGKATRKRVRITSKAEGKSFAFEASVLVPNAAKGKVGAFLLINNRPVASADPTRAEKNGFWPAEEILARGFATAVFRTWDVDNDSKDEALRKKGVRGVWPAGSGTVGQDAWATIGAWAWGASRVLDYLQSDPAIDGSKVAVVGHSRGGKTALWAAAQDERFAIAISNDSGCGGASIERRKLGETIAIINKAFPYWFCDNYKKWNDREAEMPFDQHQLIALMAPRAVYVASADEDFWADQRGEFLALAAASPVFGLYGNPAVKDGEMPALEKPLVRGRMGYHIHRGGHNLTPYDWARFMDFADGLWKREE